MKRVFGILMTILFLLVSFQQALLIVCFKMNQQQIEQTYCVNKAKPELQCHGKCHLKKELEKSENSEEALTRMGKKLEIILVSKIDFTLKSFTQIDEKKGIIHNELDFSEPYIEIIVPPPLDCFA